MKRIAAAFLGSVILICLVLTAGCQQQQQNGNKAETPTQEAPLVPYSKGPDSPPSTRGPTALPDGSVPQAVTENETVRYTLPLAPQAQVKE